MKAEFLVTNNAWVIVQGLDLLDLDGVYYFTEKSELILRLASKGLAIASDNSIVIFGNNPFDDSLTENEAIETMYNALHHARSFLLDELRHNNATIENYGSIYRLQSRQLETISNVANNKHELTRNSVWSK